MEHKWLAHIQASELEKQVTPLVLLKHAGEIDLVVSFYLKDGPTPPTASAAGSTPPQQSPNEDARIPKSVWKTFVHTFHAFFCTDDIRFSKLRSSLEHLNKVTTLTIITMIAKELATVLSMSSATAILFTSVCLHAATILPKETFCTWLAERSQ